MGLFRKKAKPILVISFPDDIEFNASDELRKDYHCIMLTHSSIKSPEVRILSESNSCNVNKNNNGTI